MFMYSVLQDAISKLTGLCGSEKSLTILYPVLSTTFNVSILDDNYVITKINTLITKSQSLRY